MEEYLMATVIPCWNSSEAARFKETFDLEFVDMITSRLNTLNSMRQPFHQTTNDTDVAEGLLLVLPHTLQKAVYELKKMMIQSNKKEHRKYFNSKASLVSI